MLKETRTIQKSGTSMVVPLTKFLKNMGLKLGDEVNILLDDGEIVITKEDTSKKRVPAIDKQIWNKFMSVIVEIHGYDNLNKKNIQKSMEEALREWMKKRTSFWKKPLFP